MQIDPAVLKDLLQLLKDNGVKRYRYGQLEVEFVVDKPNTSPDQPTDRAAEQGPTFDALPESPRSAGKLNPAYLHPSLGFTFEDK